MSGGNERVKMDIECQRRRERNGSGGVQDAKGGAKGTGVEGSQGNVRGKLSTGSQRSEWG